MNNILGKTKLLIQRLKKENRTLKKEKRQLEKRLRRYNFFFKILFVFLRLMESEMNIKSFFNKIKISQKEENNKEKEEVTEEKKDSTAWKVFDKFKDGAVMDGPEIEADILDRWALTGMATFGYCSKGGTAKITEKGKEVIPILLSYVK